MTVIDSVAGLLVHHPCAIRATAGGGLIIHPLTARMDPATARMGSSGLTPAGRPVPLADPSEWSHETRAIADTIRRSGFVGEAWFAIHPTGLAMVDATWWMDLDPAEVEALERAARGLPNESGP